MKTIDLISAMADKLEAALNTFKKQGRPQDIAEAFHFAEVEGLIAHARAHITHGAQGKWVKEAWDYTADPARKALMLGKLSGIDRFVVVMNAQADEVVIVGEDTPANQHQCDLIAEALNR